MCFCIKCADRSYHVSEITKGEKGEGKLRTEFCRKSDFREQKLMNKRESGRRGGKRVRVRLHRAQGKLKRKGWVTGASRGEAKDARQEEHPTWI